MVTSFGFAILRLRFLRDIFVVPGLSIWKVVSEL